MMIDHDELRGHTLDNVTRMIEGWRKPTIVWPEETTFVPSTPLSLHSPHTRTVKARLPNGDWYDLLTDSTDRDPRNGAPPPVLYSFLVDVETGDVWAHPRIANMALGRGAERCSIGRTSEETDREVWHGVGLGLAYRYKVGTLGRRLREITRTEIEGYE